MNHVYALQDVRLERPAIVTIGVFDGVHRGHQHLIGQLVEQARRTGRLAVVLTLFPHPDRVLLGLTGPHYLTTPEHKAELLGALGVDVVVTQRFDETTRRMRAAAFIDLLRAHLNLSSLWVTADFAMGYQREGNFAFLAAQGAEKGFEVQQTDLLASEDHELISSSRIRAALAEGDIASANDWLGRPYRVEGVVVHGDRRGHTIGFPTANIDVWAEQIIPASGVYACHAILGKGASQERFLAVTNIGRRPTFDGEDRTRVEAHLLDFERMIYGERLVLAFVARLRDEQKFSGLEALREQIGRDVARGRALLTRADQP